MGIFDFFRREKPAYKAKQVKFDELNDFISKKKQEINISELKAIESIKDRINLLLIEFENEISIIDQINLDEKKEDEKFKLVVKGNLDRYKEHLKNLKNNLKNVQSNGIQDLIQEINSAFQGFEKKSFMNFEKATFLIGEELGNVINSISNFYRDFKEILRDNKELIDTLKITNEIEKIIKDIAEFEQIRDNIYYSIKNIERETSDSQISINNLKNEIGVIINSEEYNKDLREKQESESKKDKLKLEIANLKEMIDLKRIARTYHSHEKQMRIIREYQRDFYHAFEKDDGKSIIELVDRNKEKIQEVISKIIENKKEISISAPEKDKILEIEGEIKKIENKIFELGNEKSRLEKKIFYSKEEINNTKSALKQELVKFNLELV